MEALLGKLSGLFAKTLPAPEPEPQQDEILSLGRYKGQTFGYAKEVDPEYASWVKKNATGGSLGRFKAWLEAQPEPADEFVEVPITPPGETVERKSGFGQHMDLLLSVLDRARFRVIICSPFATRTGVQRLLDKVAETRKMTRTVSVFTDPTKAFSNTAEAVGLLEAAGVVVRQIPNLHCKTLVADEDLIAEGSFNWLSACGPPSEFDDYNVTLVYRGAKAREFIQAFDRDLKDKAAERDSRPAPEEPEEPEPASAETLVKGGKHNGETFGSVLEGDRDYCRWCLRSVVRGPLLPFRDWLEDNMDRKT